MTNMQKSLAGTMTLPSRLVVVVGLALIFLLIGTSVGFAQEDTAFVRQVRVIEPDEVSLTNPAGLAFSPAGNAFYVVGARQPGQSPDSFSGVTAVTATMNDQLGTISLRSAIPDPINMAFDGKANRLLLFQPATLEFVELVAGPDGQLVSTTPTYHDARRLGLQDPQGMAVDPESGRIFVLDNAGSRIVRIDPYVDAGFANAVVTRVDLAHTGLSGLRGLAFNPANGHLYTLSPAQQTLYELTPAGHLVSMRDVSAFALSHPQGLVFAPTGDSTDDPSLTSLYIADSGLGASLDAGPDGQITPQTTGHIVELSFDGMPPMVINADVTATLVNTIDASAWITPSPDPAGIAYLEHRDTLIMSDSEVDEMPPYFTGDNVFEMTRDGSLLRTSTTISFSSEPTGVAHDPANGYLFFSDDDREQIYQVDLGPNRKYDSTDDRTSFDTEGFGCTDPEGVAFDSWNGDIFLVDGLNSEVYRVEPGGDGEFGTGDDVITHWDTSGFLSDPEGITFDPENGFLYLIGTTSDVMVHAKLDATDILIVVRTIDISAANSRSPAGLTVAPGSQDPGVMHLYMTDRGIDNGFDPWENDGKIYELYVPALEPDVAIAKSVEPAFASAGDTITYTLTFSNAGGGTASGVFITDIIPAELTVQSVISSGVEITDTGAVQPYVWQVQDLTTADRGVITITAELTSTLSCFDTFTNTATIGTTSADTRPGNNSSAVTRAAEAGVSVAPLSDSKSAPPGQNVVYTLRVTNTGHCSDTFDRSYSGGAWPVSSLPVVGPLDPDAGAPVDVTVSVPACTLGGVSDGMTVILTSQHHGAKTDSTALTTSADFVAPVAGDDQYSVLEDKSLIVAAPGVLENDSDANCESLTVGANTPPAHGTVVLDPDGSFTYTPTLNFHGIDTFTYDASDGALSGTGTVTIAVTSAVRLKVYLPLIFKINRP